MGRYELILALGLRRCDGLDLFFGRGAKICLKIVDRDDGIIAEIVWFRA
jgi:hypothetical protein